MNTNFNHFCDSSNDEQEYPNIRLQRTLTISLFEIIIGLLLLILWGGIVYKLAISNGEPIPTHIDFSGKADSFESPYWLLLVGGFCTALAVFYMYAAYHPTYLIDARLRITNMLQIKILVYWAYIITIELVSVGISLVFFCLGSLTLFLKIMVFVIILTSLVTIIAVRMAK